LLIEVKPRIEAVATCHVCGAQAQANEVLWQGIHICACFKCAQCAETFIEDLPVGQALFTPYRIDSTGQLIGDESAKAWFGKPLQDSLENTVVEESLGFKVETRRQVEHAIVLNCIDFLYGHSLLKLLNAEAYAGNHGKGLIVIVPPFLRWLVPEYAAEIWEVNIPLSKAQSHIPGFHQHVTAALAKFKSVHVSPAYSHPKEFDITHFTSVRRHDFAREDYRITFVWREDRLWLGLGFVSRALRRLGLNAVRVRLQHRKILKLFSALRGHYPKARFTVAGLGRSAAFPDWIADLRTVKFDTATERALCRAYSESRIVIGVHGSNMLLPSAHAGMSIDLMPTERWSNIAQDILYHHGDDGGDQRVAAFRHRYVPIDTSPRTVEQIVISMCRSLAEATEAFTGIPKHRPVQTGVERG
jgi:hypothetical protein